MKLDKESYRLSNASNVGYLALFVGVISLVSAGIGYKADPAQFYHSYLVAFMFWLSIGLGGLFFVQVHHLVSATWSVIIRRIAECVMTNLPFMLILFIPVYLGLHDLYHWSHTDAVAHDELLQKKAPYLNAQFFLVRAGVFFIIWTLLSTILYRTSLKQDIKHENKTTDILKNVSGPGMVLFALTLTFAAFDWLMSLTPHWYSTIFGVYFFAGSFLAALAFLSLTLIFLRANGVLREEFSIDHLHNFGKLLFAFTIFWTYISFSQYFLIWYGNIPEETEWYLHRWEGHWNYVSLFIVFGHFVFPFLFLLSRIPKRSFVTMTFISIWILFMHWVDLYWVVLPNHHHHFHFTWMDPMVLLGLGGIFVFLFWNRLISHPIIPVKDPELSASIHYSQ